MPNEEQLHEQHTNLSRFVSGLYEEASKLSSKNSAQIANKLLVQQTNRAIDEAKELLKDENDPYVKDLEPLTLPRTRDGFAREGAENRDVVLVLRHIKDALSQMETQHSAAWSMYRG